MQSTTRALPFLLALCIGCGESKPPLRYGPAELAHASPKPTRLTGKAVVEGEYLGRPNALAFVGENLLILDNAGTPALHLVSMPDGHLIRSFGGRGAGPGEYTSAWSISRDPRDESRAWVFDLGLSRLTLVEGAATADSGPPRIINIGGKANATQPVWVSDSLMVSPAFSASGRLSFFDGRGTFLRTTAPIPGDTSKVPGSVLQQAWTGTLVSNPRTGRLAIVTRYADQLEIYNGDGTPIRTVRGPFRFDPQFKVANAQGMLTMGQGDDMRHGYVSAAADDQAIYALFSGRTREGYKGDSSYGHYVHIYDWDGELKQVLDVDSDLISLAVSPDHQWLYGSRLNPEPAVVAYRLGSAQ
jgi:hypothetical protein